MLLLVCERLITVGISVSGMWAYTIVLLIWRCLVLFSIIIITTVKKIKPRKRFKREEMRGKIRGERREL